jgi:hypothetical protein
MMIVSVFVGIAVVAGLMKTFRLASLAGKRLYLSNVTRGVISIKNQLRQR